MADADAPLLNAHHRFWAIISDSMTPQEAEVVQEDLGIERDTPEHVKLERSALCQQKMIPAKRKR